MKFQIFKIPLVKFSKLYEIFEIIHMKFQIFKIPLVNFQKLYI